MAKQNIHTFKKQVKEKERKQKAKEKLDRRRGKNNPELIDVNEKDDTN